MKYLAWLLKAALFFTLFAFTLNNLEAVSVRLFFGTQWQAPLAVVLLAVLSLGICLGISVMLPVWWRAKRTLRSGPVATPPSTPDTSPLPPHGI